MEKDNNMMLDILVFLLTISSCTGITLTTSSDKATVGLDYTFTCVTTQTVLAFTRGTTTIGTITGANTDGVCVFNGGYITDYTYTCNPTTNTYTVTIPGSGMSESLHGTEWKCKTPFENAVSNTKILYVNVPISSTTLISTPTDKNPVEVVSNRKQTFSCTTNAARPSSRIQWYLSTTNIATSASPQPDVCNTDCSDDKVISCSVLTYIGNINDDGKILYCTAVNIEGLSVVRSSDKTIVIWYGPNQVIITPSTQSYTLKETENLNQIQCTADCKPNCTITWSGPNLPAGTTSVLNLQNINRNQAGNYQCTASNDVSSNTSVVINVVVQYGPNQVIITPSTQSYTLKETDNLNRIQCTADCIPNCTMTWSGPNIPTGNRYVLNLHNIKRNQAGSYQCTASNAIGSMMSVTVTIIVNYGPNQVIITPSTQSYTLKETENLNKIQCTADCLPNCTMTWSGPNIPAGTTPVLNLQNISRNQTGNYTCTASNDVSSKTSVVVNVVVQYGPIHIEISPKDYTYTVTETGSVNPITCAADCNPSCTTTWTGHNLPVGSTSILNLQNIDRSQAGVYNCTAVNEISSLTLIKVNVIVNYGPRQVVIYPTASNYIRNETLDVVHINCTANCKPACTSTWNGPNLPPGTTSVLNLTNVNRNQAGNYQCTASNDVSSFISTTIYVVVNYQPTISSISNDKEVNENDTATITCTVDSIPQSIIRWKFEDNELQDKYNGSLTFNKINCLSMGRYTCQAVNLLGDDNRDVNVTVKCSPRINRTEFDIPSTVAIKDEELLNITAHIIAFPKPEIYWQFGQNGSYLNVSKGITNSFNINRQSSNLIKSNLTEDDFGTYSVYAYNGVGNTHYLLHSVVVVPERKPNQPINVTCEGRINSVTVSWKSGFNGGKNQTFTVYYKSNDNDGNSKWTAFARTYSDPGQNMYASAEIQPLDPGTSFVFQVYASNAFNYTVSETSYCNTSEAGKYNENTDQSVIIGAGAGVGSAIAILLIIGVIVFMIKRRRDGSPGQDKKKLTKRRSSNKKDMPTDNEADDIDGLHANPMYVSAELHPNENASKKMETEKTDTANEDDGHVYSQVKKKDKKGKKEKDFEMGSVYENAEDIANSRADALRVSENATMDSKQHHKYQPKRNKDGLVYADLELSPRPSGKRFAIRGLENRNNYAIIDLTKTAEPLPSDSESENEKEKTEANDKKGNN